MKRWIALLLGFVLIAPELLAQSYPTTKVRPDQTATLVAGGTPTNLSSASAATVLPARTARRYFWVQNVGTVPIFCHLGTTASSSAYVVVLEPNAAGAADRGGDLWSLGGWIGTLSCIAASGTGRYTVGEI